MVARHFRHTGGECRCEIKTYLIAAAIGIAVFIFELTGSYLSGSLALLSDTFHVFIDTAGHVIAIVTSYLISKKIFAEKQSRSFGGFISAALLLITSLIVGYEAVQRMIDPVMVNVGTLLLFAVGGALANGVVLWLVDSRTEPNITKTNLMRHIALDLGQSLIVIASGIILLVAGYYNFSLPLIDPVLSMVLALFALVLSFKTAKEAWGLYKNK